MPAYRLYGLDGAGSFSTARWIDAADDEAALTAAIALNPGGRFELWRGNRLIRRGGPGD